MSYTRTNTDSGDPCIVFHYLSEDLFNEVNLLSLYRAQSIIQQAGDKAGETMIDEYALTEDERDAFNIFVKTALYDAFAQVVKMTKSISDTVFLNTAAFDDELSISITGDASYGFIIYDNDAYNDNVLQLVDNEILKFMRFEILYNWYELKGVDNEAAKYMAKWQASRRDLVNRYLFQLRKPLMA